MHRVHCIEEQAKALKEAGEQDWKEYAKAEENKDMLQDMDAWLLEVTALLVQGHANPTVLDARRRTPYFLASHEKAREAFRMARATLGEDYCSWDNAKVGPPLTMDDVQMKKEKAAEKKKRQKARQKEKKGRERAQAEEMEKQQQEEGC